MNGRGSAEFPVLKGFEVGIKGAQDSESGGDVARQDRLPDKASRKSAPKGSIRTNSDDLTISPELKLVEDGAARDISSGYVSDVQGAKVGKGYEQFNELCTKGIAADIELNPHNVGESLDAIQEHTGIVAKELSDGITVKSNVGSALRAAGSAIKQDVVGALKAGKSKLTSIGSKTENALRRGNAKLTRMGVSEGPGALGSAANLAGKNRTGTGAAVVGGGALAAGGAAEGTRRAFSDDTEKKT